VTRSNIQRVRQRLEALRLALLGPRPEDIDAALPDLEEAVHLLQTSELGQSHEVRRELTLLKNDLQIVARLVEHGAAFCQSWAKMLAGCPLYTQAGQSAAVEQLAGSPGTISLRG
jgi:hypothetical protein